MEKYLSIITNFGCHYTCPYCIVKKNNIEVPETTMDGLDNLGKTLNDNNITIVSLSGGGDPLYKYDEHKKWYAKLLDILFRNKIPLEMHTSYLPDTTKFPFYSCKRVVYHLHSVDDLSLVRRTGKEIVRVVFVVTENFTIEDVMKIAAFVDQSPEIDELSFRQMVDHNFEEKHYLEEYLKLGHQKLWWYIEQNDYNLYYAENKTYNSYSDFAALDVAVSLRNPVRADF